MKKFFLYLMAAGYTLAGINHFVSLETYRAIMPPYLPQPELLVLLSGVAEIICGLLLMFERTRRLGAWGVILLLIAVFPANLYMFQARDTTFVDLPSWILIARLPAQALLIWWAWLYARPQGSLARV